MPAARSPCAPVRVRRDRGGRPSCPCPERDHAPRPGADDTAGTEPAHRPKPAGRPVPVLDPRPNRAVHRGVRRRACLSGDRGRDDPRTVPERTAMPNSGYGQPGLRSPILRVRTARAEIADPMLNPGTWHLWAVPNQYAAHHNEYRPHRGRNLRPPGCRREHSGRHRRSRHAQDATSQVPGG